MSEVKFLLNSTPCSFVASKKFFRIGWCKELTSLTGILLKIDELSLIVPSPCWPNGFTAKAKADRLSSYVSKNKSI